MNGVIVPRHGYFDAIQERYPVANRGKPGQRQAAGIVVISQGERCYAPAGGARNEFVRRQRSVGKVRVAVKVDVQQLKFRNWRSKAANGL